MTRAEAIKKMQAVKAYMTSSNPIWSVTEMGEAFDMAIKALKAQPKTGKWINGHWDGDSNFRIDGRGNCWFVRECSNCHEEIEGKPTNYCPNCGCHMLEEGEEHD